MFIINIFSGYHGHLMTDRADGLLGGFLIYPKDRTTPLIDGTRIMTEREYYMILQDWATLPSDEQWFCHVVSMITSD
jgi:hypothetical protein